MKLCKIILPFFLFSLLVVSCDFLKDAFEDIGITIINKTDKEIVFTAITNLSPSYPISISAGSSLSVDILEKYRDTYFKFTYDGKTYKEGLYPSEDEIYRIFLDSEGNLKVSFSATGEGESPSEIRN